MATPLLSLPLGRSVGQVASSSAARLEAPAERSVAKDLHVHGLAVASTGDHHALGTHREGTFDAADGHHFVGASKET